jgi:hypothetical protein
VGYVYEDISKKLIKFNSQGNQFSTAFWFEEGIPCVNLQGKILRKNTEETMLYLRSNDREITCITVEPNEAVNQIKIPISVVIIDGNSIGDFTDFASKGLLAVSKDGILNTYPQISTTLSDF